MHIARMFLFYAEAVRMDQIENKTCNVLKQAFVGQRMRTQNTLWNTVKCYLPSHKALKGNKILTQQSDPGNCTEKVILLRNFSYINTSPM